MAEDRKIMKQLVQEIGKQGQSVSISKQEITELKRMNNPSTPIIQAVRAAFLTLNYASEDVDTWNKLKIKVG